MRKKFLRTRPRRNEKEENDGRETLESMETGSIIAKNIEKSQEWA